jgi:hypothetical protein
MPIGRRLNRPRKENIMKYGQNAKIANIVVFTREGAINAYKTLARICYDNLTLEASVVLSNAMLDMLALGFTAEECETIELAAIA